MENVAGGEPKVYRSKLDASGRVVLAADLRSALDLHEGDTVLLVKDDETVRIETPEQALKAAQEYFCKLAPPERILSEELLKERRGAAAREGGRARRLSVIGDASQRTGKGSRRTRCHRRDHVRRKLFRGHQEGGRGRRQRRGDARMAAAHGSRRRGFR